MWLLSSMQLFHMYVIIEFVKLAYHSHLFLLFSTVLFTITLVMQSNLDSMPEGFFQVPLDKIMYIKYCATKCTNILIHHFTCVRKCYWKIVKVNKLRPPKNYVWSRTGKTTLLKQFVIEYPPRMALSFSMLLSVAQLLQDVMSAVIYSYNMLCRLPVWELCGGRYEKMWIAGAHPWWIRVS